MQGDVITAVNGTTIESASDLVDAIAEAGSGAEIALTVTRDGASITIDVHSWRQGNTKGAFENASQWEVPCYTQIRFSPVWKYQMEFHQCL